MASKKNELENALRTKYIESLTQFFTNEGEEVLRTKSNQIALPVVDASGEECFITITCTIPHGANKGTEPYDGYEEAESYAITLKQKKEKAERDAITKQEKIKRDELRRANKAEQLKKRKEKDGD